MRKHLRKPAGKINFEFHPSQFIISTLGSNSILTRETTRFSQSLFHLKIFRSLFHTPLHIYIYIYTTPSLTFHFDSILYQTVIRCSPIRRSNKQISIRSMMNIYTLVVEQLTLVPTGFSVRRVHVGLNWRRKKPGYGPAASATV